MENQIEQEDIDKFKSILGILTKVTTLGVDDSFLLVGDTAAAVAGSPLKTISGADFGVQLLALISDALESFPRWTRYELPFTSFKTNFTPAGGEITPDVATVDSTPNSIYDNGIAGVGATISRFENGALGDIDGFTTILNSSVLVKNQGDPKENGIYTLTTVGDVSTPYVLTRNPAYDSGAELNGLRVIPQNGTQADDGLIFVQYTVTPTVGVDDIVFDLPLVNSVEIVSVPPKTLIDGTITHVIVPFSETVDVAVGISGTPADISGMFDGSVSDNLVIGVVSKNYSNTGDTSILMTITSSNPLSKLTNGDVEVLLKTCILPLT